MALVILLLATWTAAWQNGVFPDGDAWQRYEDTGNGPWNHHSLMQVYVDYIFLTALLTLALGFFTILLGPAGRHRCFGGLMGAGAVVTMWYHLLLID